MEERYNKILELWQNTKRETAADIEYLLSDFKVIFAYNSGRIENDEITYNMMLEIFEGKPVSNFSGNYRTMYEMVNQKDCYGYLLEHIIQKEPLSMELIRRVQYELAKHTYDDVRTAKGECPGEFKKGFYVVGEYQVGSAPEEVEARLKDLIAEVNDYAGSDLMTAAAYLHLVFERIHPFADANGRTGRTLLNYFLLTRDHPPIVIQYENRAQYVEAFDRFHYDADIHPMVHYLKEETVQTWKHLLRERDGKERTVRLKDFETMK